MSEQRKSKPKLPWDPYEAFAQLLRTQFRTTPEDALRRINAELAANPLTKHVQLDLPPPRAQRDPERSSA
jgi:hypothetical protein